MSDEERGSDLEIEEGGGPPSGGTAWTLDVLGHDGWSADLEHAAPLPRTGETLELIQADGARQYLQVHEVIHVLQPSATDRPLVREQEAGPSSIVVDDALTPTRLLRAGLPRVVAMPMDRTSPER